MARSPLTTVRLVPAGTPVLEPSGKPVGDLAVDVAVGLELVTGCVDEVGAFWVSLWVSEGEAEMVVDVEALGESAGLATAVVGAAVVGAAAVGATVGEAVAVAAVGLDADLVV
jgi:hypothetical protein